MYLKMSINTLTKLICSQTKEKLNFPTVMDIKLLAQIWPVPYTTGRWRVE